MIYLPPPQPVLNQDIRISGDVEIHPTASIAPGVILQAAPNHRIAIGADVCIGMGVIINAGGGSVEIDSGAILGSGVLIVGKSKIGNNCCIGTAVTIFQTDVEAMKVVEPGAILGDTSRQVDVPPKDSSANSQPNEPSPQPNTAPQNGSHAGNNYYFSSQNNQPQDNKTVNQEKREQVPQDTPPPTKAKTIIQPDAQKDKESVVGQVYINQLLVTLFPHNKDFESNGKKIE